MNHSNELDLACLDAACGGATNTYSSSQGGNTIHVTQSGGQSSLAVNGETIYWSGFDFDIADFAMPSASELAGYDFADFGFSMPDLTLLE